MNEQHVDPIEPIRIEHAVDEVWEGEQLLQRYNFLDYYFERDGAHCRARAYADDFQDAALFGPSDSQGGIRNIVAPDFERDVLLYLQRRFPTISRQ
jgi:hypothetical protein